MEVGPFRTVPASQTESGEVEVKLVTAGWEEFSTIVFGEPAFCLKRMSLADMIVDQPPGTGYSYVPTNGYLHELDQVCCRKRVLKVGTDQSGVSALDKVHGELLLGLSGAQEPRCKLLQT